MASQIQQASLMAKQLQNSSNPMGLLNMMAQKNPKLSDAITSLQNCGGDPQKAFYDLAKRKGADPSQVLNLLK